MTKASAVVVVLVLGSPALARDRARCEQTGDKASKLCIEGMTKSARPDYGPEMSFAGRACKFTGEAVSLGCERDQLSEAAVTYCGKFDATMRMVIPTICEMNGAINQQYAHIPKVRRAQMCKLAAEYCAAKVKEDCSAKNVVVPSSGRGDSACETYAKKVHAWCRDAATHDQPDVALTPEDIKRVCSAARKNAKTIAKTAGGARCGFRGQPAPSSPGRRSRTCSSPAAPPANASAEAIRGVGRTGS
jgi:hypothetical protein